MVILPVKDKSPIWGEDCFIAENATIVGDVVMGSNCSVWFNAVIRGDVHYIRIGDNTNIQDGAVIHATYLRAPTNIGSNVSIGHNALVHGCTLHDHTLVGMGAIVMDHAVVNQFVIIAAGAVVLENTVCESGFLYAGMPAKKIKPLTDQQIELLKQLPKNYSMYSGWFME
ncbi:gamma carbonic anhydrase family protein [Mucilaginibacter sp. OK283]|jgi:carbonic anhydrase/acetyltransferase-like protein (isoleucine patch superfamily)|uniref:gamma carbonic anhydrase family protein n=1 Tax=Mucilaginibacter sp. OK283 TaxID=1881049 RepID=UPI0008B0A154|nr:gamma carbonic anhydrase family protein [Mucilaginibacter sp. OK283]SEP46145.1 Carbonic anhydrase or acetyltransferase, isoleucine patch superfamily [Mucilaginibacter sp. OK283]